MSATCRKFIIHTRAGICFYLRKWATI